MAGQLIRDARDAREFALPAVLFHDDAETLLQVPGQGIAVDGARRLHPAIDRMLMQRPPFAVPLRPGRIEDHAMGMKLRIVVPAGAVLKQGGGNVGRQHLDLAVPVTNTGPGEVPQHRLFQRRSRRIVMRLFDLRTQLGIGYSP